MDELTQHEIEYIKLGLSEINKGKYRCWTDIKGELPSDKNI
jgi:hypothetical protein